MEFDEALHQRPDIPGLHPPPRTTWGWSTLAPHDGIKPKRRFRAETKMQPGNAEAAYRLGAALLQQGKAHEARQELARADRLKPDMPETLYSLGKAASLDGNPAAAEKAWTRVIALEKETSLAAQAHFGLAKSTIANKEMQRRRNTKCRNTRSYRAKSSKLRIRRNRGTIVPQQPVRRRRATDLAAKSRFSYGGPHKEHKLPDMGVRG